jgi:hypothetical protein
MMHYCLALLDPVQRNGSAYHEFAIIAAIGGYCQPAVWCGHRSLLSLYMAGDPTPQPGGGDITLPTSGV